MVDMACNDEIESLDYLIKKRKEENASIEKLARDIAYKLREKKLNLVKLVIEIAGRDIATTVLGETLKKEKEGGVMTCDGKRRTAGGAYFTILKDFVTKEQYKEIYRDETKLKNKMKKKARQKKRLREAEKENPVPMVSENIGVEESSENPRFKRRSFD